MFKFITNIFDQNKKTLDRYENVVQKINALEPTMKKKKNKQLAQQTNKLKKQLASLLDDGKTEQEVLDTLLPEAYATVREVSKRTTGMRHFDVQLIAGIAFHEGKIAEQKTGEGKTLSCTTALYLNALTEKGTHLVTVNDYLAQIGAGWMGQIYHFLGLSVGVIIHDQAYLYDPEFQGEERGDDRLEHFKPVPRKQAYAADITYGTNNEFGFDYLRDNMAQSLEQMVQREHNFAIVDEADSILIDEARTPLIISAPDTEPTKKYYRYAKLVQTLTKEQDYKVDEKMKTATLTDLGVKRLERKLNINNLYEQDYDTIHHIEAALKARTLYHRDKEYIVRDDQVIIVDEHTGRLMHGRRYSDGLHQAIEAKESVSIQQESRTLATVSLQNYFRLYNKLAGMTGTAATEAEEFQKIYNSDVVIIPTNKPIVRKDHADVVYKTTRAKYGALVQEVKEKQEQGQPVLIGTRSIEHNQIISNYLKRKKVKHELLNAKNHEQEAFIISDAGKLGQVTVATNIAGRGVDIVLGGAKPEEKDYKTKKAFTKAQKEWEENHQKVLDAGGLHVIGSERHESRRIDNQLRGRSGRQGDPGSSRFYVSLEDEIMRIFGGEQISKVMDFLKIDENQPIEHSMVAKSIENAQVKVEGFFFDQRKRLVEFDDVMNKQREIIYKRRRRLLEQAEHEAGNTKTKEQDEEQESLKEQIFGYIQDEIETSVSLRAPQDFTEDEMDAIVKEFITLIPFDDASQKRLRDELTQLDDTNDIVKKLMDVVEKTYTSREEQVGEQAVRGLERFVVLSTIDQMWMDHLDDIQVLRDGIWLRGDKQTVLSEYKKEAFSMFESLVQRIESEIAKKIFRVQVVRQPQTIDLDQVIEQKPQAELQQSVQKQQQKAPTNMQGSTADLANALKTAKGDSSPTPGIAKTKIKRNDPCPCGAVNPKSGKPYKWKKCGLINAPHHKG